MSAGTPRSIGARWTVTGRLDRLRALFAEAGDDGQPIGRAAGDHAGQHPLAERLQRIGRPAAGHRRRRPAHHRRAVPDPVRRAAGGGRRRRRRSTIVRGRRAGPARGAGGRRRRRSAALGLEADHVTWSSQRTLGGAPGLGGDWCPPGEWSRGCGRSRTPARWPGWSGPRPSPTQALAEVLPLLAAAGAGAGRAHRIAVRRRPRPRHAPGRGRGERLRDHRGVGRELGQAPRPAR